MDNKESLIYSYKYKTVSVDHLNELQEDIDKLKCEGKISDNKTFRSYIDEFKFEIPEDFPNAKSVIILAFFTRLSLVNFHLTGKKHEVMIPPGYYITGRKQEEIQDIILKEIIKEPGYKIEPVKGFHLKRLAVRSGLGEYGRNNLCYVEGMGSFLALFAYFTDFEFEEDNWNEVRMMDHCKQCRICMNQCPNNCITEENFVIDVDKCITLYNEIPGEFPEWISSDVHNALMGCMKCQFQCPGNRKIIEQTQRFEDVTEEETKKILTGAVDEELLNSLHKKIKMFYPENGEAFFPILKRNLSVLIGHHTLKAYITEKTLLK
ncbi:MAG: 4Fe-4S double cluster binding domain-containing protein [Candidatus Hodarchaeota archaeon]